MAELNQWPFRPVHITNNGDSDEVTKDLSGEGIISNKFMKGQQSAMCALLNQPTTFIEFSPNPDEKPFHQCSCVRTDTPLLPNALSPLCRAFRKWTRHECCK